MALARVNRHQQSSATFFGTGGFTTSAFTPSDNSLVVVFASAISISDGGMEGTDLTITDSVGLTWTSRVATTTSPFWSYGSRAWTAPVTVGASMTVTIDCGAFDIDAYRVEVYDYTGYSTTQPVGGTIVGSDADGDGSATIVLSEAPRLIDETLGMAADVLNASTAPEFTPGVDFTELFEGNILAAFYATQTQVRASSLSTDVNWVDLDVNGGVSDGATLCALVIRSGEFIAPAGPEKTPFFIYESGDEDYKSHVVSGTRWFDHMLIPIKWFHEWLEVVAGGTTYFVDNLAGTLTTTGALVKQTNKTLAGTLTTAGALVKETLKTLAGTLTTAGDLIKQTNKILGGTLSFTGLLETARVFLRALDGTLSFDGTLNKQTNKVVSGTLSFVGTLSKQTNKVLNGILNTAGSLTKQTSKFFSGTLNFSSLLDTFRIPASGAAVRRSMRRLFSFLAGRR